MKRKQQAKNPARPAGGYKLLTIIGPTSSGKSDLAVRLAKKFNGEIISADSRQVYKGMDIGTGKITKKEMQGIPHYLLDVVSPKKRFSVVQYRQLALKAIDKIFQNKKLPILCGGTGFYIQAVIDGIIIPPVKPDWKLRQELEKSSTIELFKRLKNLDPKRADNIDKSNKRRLVRALEIIIKTKKTIPELKKNPLPYPVMILGIKKEKEELKDLIQKRLLKRLKQGMIEEIKNLRKSGVSWKRMEEFGLEYRYLSLFLRQEHPALQGRDESCRRRNPVVSRSFAGYPAVYGGEGSYLQNKISYQGMIEKLQKEIEHFAKRQITWWRKDKRIIWIENIKEAEKLVKNFLKPRISTSSAKRR